MDTYAGTWLLLRVLVAQLRLFGKTVKGALCAHLPEAFSQPLPPNRMYDAVRFHSADLRRKKKDCDCFNAYQQAENGQMKTESETSASTSSTNRNKFTGVAELEELQDLR